MGGGGVEGVEGGELVARWGEQRWVRRVDIWGEGAVEEGGACYGCVGRVVGVVCF